MKSYRAHLAAAEKSLRLNEGPEARQWLEAAPVSLRGWEWRHLYARVDESTRSFPLDVDSLTAFAVSDDESLAVGADSSGKIYVWSLPDLTLLRRIKGHTDAVFSVAFNRNADLIVSVARDVTSRIWERATGVEVARISLDNPAVAAATFAPDGKTVATCSWTSKDKSAKVRGVVWIWNAMTGEIIHRTLIGIKPLNSIEFTPDGNSIAVGSWDGLVHVLDKGGSELHTIKLPASSIYNAVQGVATSGDGKWLAAGSKDRNAYVWELASGKLVSSLQGHAAFVNAVGFSPDSEMLVTGSVDGSLRLWDWRNGHEHAVLHGHARAVEHVRWLKDRIYSTSRDGSLKNWDPTAAYGARLAVDTGIKGTYTAAFSPDGQTLAVAAYDGRVILLDPHTGETVAKWFAHQSASCNSLSISGDGRRLVTCSWDRTAKLWDIDSKRLLQTFEAGGGVSDCLISTDGRRVILAVGSSVQVWNAETAVRSAELKGHTSPVQKLALSPDGKRLASASVDKSVRIWNLDSNNDQPVIIEGDAAWKSASFSPDGKTIAAGDYAGSIYLFHVDTGKRKRVLLQGDSRINHLAFHPDGSRLAAAADSLQIIAVPEGGRLLGIQPHADTVWHLSFSPDGTRVASCSWNGTIAVSETASLAQRASSARAVNQTVLP